MASLKVYMSFYASLLKSLLALAFARLYAPQRPSRRDLSGQIAIVTGSNSGIGLSIATQLVRQGATVYLACRNTDKGERAVDEIVSKIGEKSIGRVQCWKLDTSDLASVRSFCEQWTQEERKINMLVHNAGIASIPPNTPSMTKDGKDLIELTNFIGSFLMTHLLESSLSTDARVVLTSSTGHYGAERLLQPRHAPSTAKPSLFKQFQDLVWQKLNLSSPAPAYAHSKGQQVLFAYLLQRHFSATPQNQKSAHSFTPGFTSTEIFGKFDITWRTWLANPLFAILKVTERYIAVTSEEGSRTGAWLAAGEANEGGGFWEWGNRRTSLIDFLEAKMGEEKFVEKCRKEWELWETDSGEQWDVRIG